jgi:hypothetical protein
VIHLLAAHAATPSGLWHFIAVWFFRLTGASNEGGWVYGFWSGWAGGFLAPNIAFSAVGVGALRHLNCDHGGTFPHGCKRLGSHRTATGHKLCKAHVAMAAADLDLHGVHPSHLTT